MVGPAIAGIGACLADLRHGALRSMHSVTPPSSGAAGHAHDRVARVRTASSSVPPQTFTQSHTYFLLFRRYAIFYPFALRWGYLRPPTFRSCPQSSATFSTVNPPPLACS